MHKKRSRNKQSFWSVIPPGEGGMKEEGRTVACACPRSRGVAFEDPGPKSQGLRRGLGPRTRPQTWSLRLLLTLSVSSLRVQRSQSNPRADPHPPPLPHPPNSRPPPPFRNPRPHTPPSSSREKSCIPTNERRALFSPPSVPRRRDVAGGVQRHPRIVGFELNKGVETGGTSSQLKVQEVLNDAGGGGERKDRGQCSTLGARPQLWASFPPPTPTIELDLSTPSLSDSCAFRLSLSLSIPVAGGASVR